MVQVVDLGEVADVEFVDEGEVHLRILDIQISLEVAGVFHCQDYFFFGQVIRTEYVEAVFGEVSVES